MKIAFNKKNVAFLGFLTIIIFVCIYFFWLKVDNKSGNFLDPKTPAPKTQNAGNTLDNNF